MEFFDTEFTSETWDPRKIFMSCPPERKLSHEAWYAFSKSERPPSSSDFPTDKPSPLLLSFAQLLLAIEEGKRIDPDAYNRDVPHEARSLQLFLQLARAEEAGCGVYADAVRGCLFSHIYLESELESLAAEDADVMAAVRTVIYEKIVMPLEAALDPPRRGQKRMREDCVPNDAQSRQDSIRRNNAKSFKENRSRLANVGVTLAPCFGSSGIGQGIDMVLLDLFAQRASRRRTPPSWPTDQRTGL